MASEYVTNKSLKSAGSLLAALLIILPAAFPALTMAAEPARVSGEKPMLDPWVPSGSRPENVAIPTQGASLQAQVERKLLASFIAADAKGNGTITKAQAQAAGLGFLVNNFDQIDQRKRGAVNFDEVKSYLRSNGAQLP